MKHRISVVTAAVLATSAARAEGPLPFPDGRYVTDPSICAMDESTMVDRLTDKLGRYVRILRGSNIEDGYELYCGVSNVRRSGSDVFFDASCEAEGETRHIDGHYVAVGAEAFALGGSVFRRCGSTPSSEDDIARTSADRDFDGEETSAGDYPLASCKSWNGKVTSLTGIDSRSAVMKGVVTRADLREYCERDPGGETTQYGGRLTIEQCVDQYAEEYDGTALLSEADCSAGTVAFRYGSDDIRRATFPMSPDADTSCASGMPPLIYQFQMMCPRTARGVGIE